jgi:probable HAF family extracellular repeat protein
LWEDGAAVDINALLPENSGWTLGGAYGINNSGQIVGYGDHNESVRAFLMTPEPSTVPAPGALVLGLLGLGGIGAARRARSARR